MNDNNIPINSYPDEVARQWKAERDGLKVLSIITVAMCLLSLVLVVMYAEAIKGGATITFVDGSYECHQVKNTLSN